MAMVVMVAVARLALIIGIAVPESSLFISAFYLRASAAVASCCYTLPYMHTHHNEGKIQHWQFIAT